MSDFFKALRIYTTLNRYILETSEIKDEFDLTDEELEAVMKFYTERKVYRRNKKTGVYHPCEKSVLESRSRSCLIEKLDSLDILNASVMAKYKDITTSGVELFTSNKSVPVFDKRPFQKEHIQKEQEAYKPRWLDAIVKRKKVEIKFRNSVNGRIAVETVKPLGLYYQSGLDQERIVYQSVNEDKLGDVELRNVKNMIVMEKKRFAPIAFSIDDYLKKGKIQEIVLRVYSKEADVDKKLADLYGNDLTEISETEEYKRVSIKVEDPMRHCELLESFGMSVIVEKPKELREKILTHVDESLQYYKLEGKK